MSNETPQTTLPTAGDAASSPSSGDSRAGAAGSSGQFGNLSQGGLIAVIVVVVCVVIFGVLSATLWYLAKKRSWEVRASIRKSAMRVKEALTPRRTEFPKDVLDVGGKENGGSRMRGGRDIAGLKTFRTGRLFDDVEKGTGFRVVEMGRFGA